MSKFYKTTFTVEILSENPIPEHERLGDILTYGCVEGDYVLKSINKVNKVLTAKQTAKALLDAGSEPAFFMLNDDGTPSSY